MRRSDGGITGAAIVRLRNMGVVMDYRKILNLFIILVALFVVSATFVGCATTCPTCRGVSTPGSLIKCEQCNNTGQVGGPFGR